MPATDVYSTRAAEADVPFDGAPVYQFPNVYDSHATSFLNNEAWLMTNVALTFQLPSDWSTQITFFWEFAEADRGSRLWRHIPADSDNVDPTRQTVNDDLDATSPEWVAASC